MCDFPQENFEARYYGPRVGRFTGEEIYRGDGLNIYAYVRNNPVMWVDTSGYMAHDRSKEIFLDTASDHDLARKMLFKELDDMNVFTNGNNPSIERLEKSCGFGKQIGRESFDSKVRWCLDFDNKIGVHFNIEDFRNGKQLNAIKKVIPIDISELEYKKIINLWNR